MPCGSDRDARHLVGLEPRQNLAPEATDLLEVHLVRHGA